MTVFALEKGVGKIDLKVSANELFTAVGPLSKTIALSQSGEEVVTFRLKVNKETGVGKVRVTATSSGDRLRFGDRTGRTRTQPLCNDVGGLHAGAGQNDRPQAPEGYRKREGSNSRRSRPQTSRAAWNIW